MVLAVVTQMDDGTVLILDVVTIEVEVEEPAGFDPVGPIIVLVAALIAIAALVLRRRG